VSVFLISIWALFQGVAYHVHPLVVAFEADRAVFLTYNIQSSAQGFSLLCCKNINVAEPKTNRVAHATLPDQLHDIARKGFNEKPFLSRLSLHKSKPIQHVVLRILDNQIRRLYTHSYGSGLKSNKNKLCGSLSRIMYSNATMECSTFVEISLGKANYYISSNLGRTKSFAKFVRFLYFHRRFAGVFDGFQSGIESPLDIPNTQRSETSADRSQNDAPESPARGILLSVKILAGFGFLLGGFYGFGDTLNRSRAFTPGAGAKRVTLFTIVVLAGCYLIASTLYAKDSPRCVAYSNDTEQRQNAKQCF